MTHLGKASLWQYYKFGPQGQSISTNLGTAGRTLTTSSVVQFDGVVSGPGGGITKSGTGTLTLSATNTYTGGTTVNCGTLNVDNPDTVGAVTLTSGTISGYSVLTGTSDSVASGTISAGLAGIGT